MFEFFNEDRSKALAKEKRESILDWTIVVVGLLLLALATIFLGPAA